MAKLGRIRSIPHSQKPAISLIFIDVSIRDWIRVVVLVEMASFLQPLLKLGFYLSCHLQRFVSSETNGIFSVEYVTASAAKVISCDRICAKWHSKTMTSMNAIDSDMGNRFLMAQFHRVSLSFNVNTMQWNGTWYGHRILTESRCQMPKWKRIIESKRRSNSVSDIVYHWWQAITVAFAFFSRYSATKP